MPQLAGGHIGFIVPIRRKYEQAAPLTMHIPRPAFAQMIHQGPVFPANKQRNILDARMHHIGHHEVDQAVPPSKGTAAPHR